MFETLNPAFYGSATTMGAILTHIITVSLITLAAPGMLTASPTAWQAGARGGDVRIKNESGEEVTLYKESHALVIGISEYDNGWDDLGGVKEDVPAVKEVLEKHSFKVEVEENLTGQQLEAAIKKFIRRHGESPGNRLLIYFAGHGHTLTTAGGVRVGYIVPKDAPNPAKNIAQFKEVAVSMNQIHAYALQIESKHALFIFDSCFAGTIFDSTRASPPHVIYKLAASPVRQFITAGGADEVVPNKSFFRAQFVEGLNGAADADGNGYITGSELGMFLQNRVTNYTRGAHSPQWGKINHPRLDDGEFIFQLGRAAAARIDADGPTHDMPAADQRKAAELMYWDSIKNSTNTEDFKAYLEEYPKGFFVKLARNRIAALKTPVDGVTDRSDDTLPAYPFTLTSRGSTGDDSFDYDVECVGEYRIYPSSVSLNVKRMTLRATGSRYGGRRELVSTRFGLGLVSYEKQESELRGASRKHSVGITLNPGGQYEQILATYSLPRDGTFDPAGTQLILELKSKPAGRDDITVTIFVKSRAGFFDKHNSQSSHNAGATNGDNASPGRPHKEGPPPLRIPHGPNDLAPRSVYVVGSNKTELVLRALTVNTNDNASLNRIVTKARGETETSGSHAWDGKWYYWRLRGNDHLLLAWAIPAEHGWVIIQKTESLWWYKTNSGQWKQIKAGETEDVFWMVEGTKISIAIEVPDENANGWTADDIKYKFGS